MCAMYLKKPKASTDPGLRSLLQKSVRRGATAVVEATVRRLLLIGDHTWLRSRAAVITFEEAWPLAASLLLTKDHSSKLAALLRVTASRKNKDAAGLGALAFAAHGGDQSMLDLVPCTRLLQLVSEALDRPPAFFEWASSQCSSEPSGQLVGAAQRYLPAATWGWDKATILGGALLAATSGVPVLAQAGGTETEFPFWVALDKHTPEGKVALHRISERCGQRYRQMIWSGFYCESAVVDELERSPWFEAEREWRLRKAGLTVPEAFELWSRVRPHVQSEVSVGARKLREQVQLGLAGAQDLFSQP